MDKAKPRWGIFAVAALMCLVTMFVGSKGSMYVFIWGLIAYQAFRGDLDRVALELKVIIVINVALAVPIFLFVGDSSDFWRWTSGVDTKNTVFYGFLITLAVKVGMLTYVNGQREAAGGIKSAGVLSGIAAASPQDSDQINMPIQSPNIAQEDAWYEHALDELNSGETVKATWARAMVEGAGDDAKTKAAYIRLRLVQLQSTYQGIPIAALSSGEPAINDDATVSDDAGGDSGKKIQTSLEEVIPSEAKGEIPRNLVASSTATLIWSAGDWAIVMLIVIVGVGVGFGMSNTGNTSITGNSRSNNNAQNGVLAHCQGSYNTSNWTNCIGTFVYDDGRRYVGGFYEKFYHGDGVLYRRDGTVEKSGTWSKGEFVGNK